ncbi:NAD(P)-dependent glycerol-3-phosphate dehydrogenase [Paracoccus suum]|uniref:Glycerol-3-phosphate dehydrogenase [NAD(P)+] n=1 Tax=Paracoccus suum TaxID=2259340 RepID=A0A344PIE7_9RHOB|nr:NAD(P)H-dependent glycerol-3-phosphate dehydrogenase [Paracoccus suum]AXC49152.1 NAD(P)-dependent glycerol-3-phosphate dehydrogenase [Paracoccus suum]
MSGPDIAIVGAGAFGSALALALAPTRRVVLWGRNPPRWPAGADLTEKPRTDDAGLTVTTDLAQATAPITLLALPAQALRPFLSQHGPALSGALVSTAKGIDLETLEGPSRSIARACPGAVIAVLTGPSFAADIARGLPTALTLACADPQAEAIQHALATPTLRLYRTADVTGAELGGALKNVIAIAAGAAIGAGFGDSARAAIVTRGFAEMTRLATRLGAEAETLVGLSGLGDLILTSTSDQSRNFRYGLSLGRGQTFDAGVTVEGAATARAVARLAPRVDVEMPVASQVAALSEGRTTIAAALATLLNRPLREE